MADEARAHGDYHVPPMGGLMALPGAELAKVVDDTVAMLRVVKPQWIEWFGDSLHARVQEILLNGEAEARECVAKGEPQGVYGTGGIWVRYDAEDGQTTVTVQVTAAWDTSEEES